MAKWYLGAMQERCPFMKMLGLRPKKTIPRKAFCSITIPSKITQFLWRIHTYNFSEFNQEHREVYSHTIFSNRCMLTVMVCSYQSTDDPYGSMLSSRP